MGDYSKVNTPEGSFSVYIDRPEKIPAPAVVVLHEVFGVNKDMRQSCRELAEHGFIAACPDLFWRQEPGLDLNHWSEAEWKKGLALYNAYDFDVGVSDVQATVAMARSLPDCNGKVGIMGYCLGGLMTFLTAARSHIDAGVEYYGGGTEKYIAESHNIASPMIMHLGEEDEFISKPAQTDIRASLKGNSNVTIYGYPGCSHAFARHTGTHFDEKAANLANGRTYDFFHQQLG